MTRRSVTALQIETCIKNFILLQLLLLHLIPICSARSIYGGEQTLQQQTYYQPEETAWSQEIQTAPQKRRLVIRVPFATNPEAMQLSRIYKSLFTQKEKKELGIDRILRARAAGS